MVRSRDGLGLRGVRLLGGRATFAAMEPLPTPVFLVSRPRDGTVAAGSERWKGAGSSARSARSHQQPRGRGGRAAVRHNPDSCLTLAKRFRPPFPIHLHCCPEGRLVVGRPQGPPHHPPHPPRPLHCRRRPLNPASAGTWLRNGAGLAVWGRDTVLAELGAWQRGEDLQGRGCPEPKQGLMLFLETFYTVYQMVEPGGHGPGHLPREAGGVGVEIERGPLAGIPAKKESVCRYVRCRRRVGPRLANLNRHCQLSTVNCQRRRWNLISEYAW